MPKFESPAEALAEVEKQSQRITAHEKLLRAAVYDAHKDHSISIKTLCESTGRHRNTISNWIDQEAEVREAQTLGRLFSGSQSIDVSKLPDDVYRKIEPFLGA